MSFEPTNKSIARVVKILNKHIYVYETKDSNGYIQAYNLPTAHITAQLLTRYLSQELITVYPKREQLIDGTEVLVAFNGNGSPIYKTWWQ